MNSATILVVDDEAQIRRVLRSTLSSNGYDVLEAKNGDEAIETAVRARPDLILLDVNMPGISGLELLTQIRNEATPAILITAHDDEQVRNRVFAAGAVGFFLKPFDNRQLISTVKDALHLEAS